MTSARARSCRWAIASSAARETATATRLRPQRDDRRKIHCHHTTTERKEPVLFMGPFHLAVANRYASANTASVSDGSRRAVLESRARRGWKSSPGVCARLRRCVAPDRYGRRYRQELLSCEVSSHEISRVVCRSAVADRGHCVGAIRYRHRRRHGARRVGIGDSRRQGDADRHRDRHLRRSGRRATTGTTNSRRSSRAPTS